MVKLCKYNKAKAFTLVEILVAMTLLGIFSAAAMPLFTQLFSLRTGINKHVAACINKNPNPSWYTNETGSSVIPTETADSPCYFGIMSVFDDKSNAVNTAIRFAQSGTENQKTAAKKLLRAACDAGGARACDYFINTCIKSGSNAYPYCDDINSFTDLTYYLHQNRGTSTNKGIDYINSTLDKMLIKAVPKLVEEIKNACDHNQMPALSSAAFTQNLNDNFSCNLSSAKLYIQSCNEGNNIDCKTAFDNNFNTSCTAVKTNWEAAPSGNYQLTADGNPEITPTREVYCEMSNYASAAISGCNANPFIPNDCTEGYNNFYNRTCEGIFYYLKIPEDRIYSLTTNGLPPTNSLVPTTCTIDSECINSGPGTKCQDGSVYAGLNTDGHYIFAAPIDQSGGIKWAQDMMKVVVGAYSKDDGIENTDKLNAATDKFSPYYGANICKGLKDDSFLDRNDWYIPSINELKYLLSNEEQITSFTRNSNYMSSTETGRSNYYYATSPTVPSTIISAYIGAKYTSSRLRCISRIETVSMSCPNIGDRCSDETIYAGNYNGNNLYIPKYDSSPGVTWNNGTSGNISTGANSLYNGQINYQKLTTSPITFNIDAPFPAVNLCKSLNEANGNIGTSFDGGVTYHNDWYLPSVNEFTLIYNNKTKGVFKTSLYSTGFYWTSTEYSDTHSYYNLLNSGSTYGYNWKIANYRVRCVRRSY